MNFAHPRFTRGLPLLASVGLLLGQAAPAAAAQVFNQTLPITFVVGACNGDVVTASGQAHLLMSVTQDASGGFHFDINGNLENVKGVGVPSGSPYTITSWFHDSANGGSGATDVSSTGVFHVISNGSSQNFVATAILHFTVTPNGALTGTASNLRAQCVG